MKFEQLEKPSVIGAPTRGAKGSVKQNKKSRNRWIRRQPVEEKPLTNRYRGWWY